MGSDVQSMGDRRDEEYDIPDRPGNSRPVRVLLARWKHAAVAAVVGATAWALYQIGGGWTIDATVFAVATVGVVAYGLLTLKSDVE